ncbi:hypothetical protein [Pseudoxanthomonas sp.]|uniref:hypothetical protein n=1 Tax=Pseudoxanthomonas sp. TaxID=1871049 RepID=UPI002FDF4560
MEIAPMCATGMLAAATLAVVTFAAPAALLASRESADAGCGFHALIDSRKEGTRG